MLPRPNTPLGTHFVANRNTLASDEIQAHTGMFDSKTNDGYYELGLSTAQLVRVAVQRHRLASAPPQPPKKSPLTSVSEEDVPSPEEGKQAAAPSVVPEVSHKEPDVAAEHVSPETEGTSASPTAPGEAPIEAENA